MAVDRAVRLLEGLADRGPAVRPELARGHRDPDLVALAPVAEIAERRKVIRSSGDGAAQDCVPSRSISASTALTAAQSIASSRPGRLRTKSKASGAARNPIVDMTPAPSGKTTRGQRRILAIR